MSTERRRHPRSNLDILVNKYVDGEPHTCHAVNVSRSGMLVHKIFEPTRPLERVEIEFVLPGTDRVLRASGIALAESAEARAHAVRFVEMSDADVSTLESFLAMPRASAAAG